MMDPITVAGAGAIANSEIGEEVLTNVRTIRGHSREFS